MILTSLILADYATVREGVLNILGGGINKLQRTAFPARMESNVALMVKLENAEDVQAEHIISVGLTMLDGDKLVAEVRLRWPGTSAANEIPAPLPVVPIIVPTDDIRLPSAGFYSLFVKLDGREAGRLDFVAQQAGDPSGAADDLHPGQGERSVKNLA